MKMELMNFEIYFVTLLLTVSLCSSSDGYNRAKTFYWSRTQSQTPFSYRSSQIGPLPMINQLMTEWSTWGSWKQCSRSCGEGVRSRTRACVSKVPRVMPGSGIRTSHNRCHGESIHYEMCGKIACPAGEVSAVSFRAAQCRKYNNRKVLGRMVTNWVPFNQGGINPCALVCEGEGEGIVYTFGKVNDGTHCKTEAGLKGLCVNGRCMHLACDGRLGGGAEEDMCRVCGGHNETCTKHTGVYHSELPSSDQPYPGTPQRLSKKKKSFGYYEVTQIPRGSTNVKVFDNSSNFLALKSTTKYLLNGDWLIDWPGDVEAGGTTFSYLRKEDQSEYLTSLGPTDDNIVLMVLLREHNPGIFYEYWTPSRHTDPFSRQSFVDTSWRPVPATSRITTTLPPAASPTKQTSKPAIITAYSLNKTLHNRSFALLPVPAALRATPSGREDSIQESSSTHKRTGKSKHARRKQEKTQISRNEVRLGKKRKIRKNKKRKKRPSYCKDCSKRKRMRESFCTSDFVSRVQVLNRDVVGEFYRVEVLVQKSYKNTMPLSHKEFLWQHRCACRVLKPRHTYVAMGVTQIGKGREVKLLLKHNSFVKKFSPATHQRILKIRQHEMRKCRKWRKDSIHHRKLIEKFYRHRTQTNTIVDV